MTIMRTFTVAGALIAYHRERAGLDQPQLAKKLGVGQTAVSHWEAGRRSPSPANLKRLCAVLKVRREDLIEKPDSVSAA